MPNSPRTTQDAKAPTCAICGRPAAPNSWTSKFDWLCMDHLWEFVLLPLNRRRTAPEVTR